MTPAPAPLISIVMPVYGVRSYLGECLDSVLADPAAPPIEVIAVDDASPDGCGDLLDEQAAGDRRLTVLHLERNHGPGHARNLGLATASGEYVWFVDGDDSVAPGALAAIAARLTAGRPDVLLIDYEDRYPDGRTAPSPGAALLRSAPPGTFTLAQAPEMVHLTMTAWSKLLRREFLLGLGESFRPGIHEDIPVTCAALLAGSLGALGRVCYSYRRSRGGSFMATSSTAHLAVFDAYDEVLGRVAALAQAGDPVVTPAVRDALFERAIWHYSTVLQARGADGAGGIVPRSQRRGFFHRMHAEYVRWAPAGFLVPAGARGAKFRLIQRDAYLAYELLEPVNRLRVAVRGALLRALGRVPGRGPA